MKTDLQIRVITKLPNSKTRCTIPSMSSNKKIASEDKWLFQDSFSKVNSPKTIEVKTKGYRQNKLTNRKERK